MNATTFFSRNIQVKQKKVLVVDTSTNGNSLSTKSVVRARVIECCFVRRNAFIVSIDIPEEELVVDFER